ncbi:MAG: mechanosensitive ion channel family protein [Clostridia bacterium]|nr:mechanosensitive ion channel family protein [Clostridia bacterium]
MDQIVLGWNNFVESIKNAGTAVVENLPQIATGLLVILLFIIFRHLLSKNIAKIFTKVFKRHPVIGAGIRTSVQEPLKAFFLALGLYIGIAIMNPPAAFMAGLTVAFRVCVIVLIAWALANFTPFLTSQIIKMEETNKRANAVAVRFVANMLKIVIISISVVVIIGELGYNIGGLITGIGLGGLTFSLAAQNTASDLFAGFSIVSDKPFDVGDYIVTPSGEGKVEDITMRSTRIRTVADTVVIMPNSKLINEPITNCSKLNRRFVDMTIGLTYDTDSATLRNCIEDIKAMLQAHEDVSKDRIVVVFAGFSDSSQDIRIIFSVDMTALDPSLVVREDINFRLKEIIEKNGASFAFPSITVYNAGEDKA